MIQLTPKLKTPTPIITSVIHVPTLRNRWMGMSTATSNDSSRNAPPMIRPYRSDTPLAVCPDVAEVVIDPPSSIPHYHWMDPIAQFKEAQKRRWLHFAPLETFTTPAAAQLVRHARIRSGQRVLDVACGTGVVAITAARAGARVSAIDLTPPLLERARASAQRGGLAR